MSEQYLAVAKEAALSAGRFLMENLGKSESVIYNGARHFNPVSAVDTGAECIIGTVVSEHVLMAKGMPEDSLSWHVNYTVTGPHKLIEFMADDYLLLERNDDYWGKDVPEVGLPEAE